MQRRQMQRSRTRPPSPDLLVIACTGGIGAGKSTVAGLLGRRGAVVVDADALARAALEPGGPGYGAVVSRFGAEVLVRPSVPGPGAGGPEPSRSPASGGPVPPPIDRDRLAAVVFHDPAALAALEDIVHPVVRRATDEVLAAHAGSDDVIVLELPLLRGRDGAPTVPVDGVLVVDAPEDVALDRLVRHRHMDPDDARARMAAQGDRLARIRLADFVIENLGTRDELDAMVARAWAWIEDLRTGRPAGAGGGRAG